jgi:DNA-binding HxlR family transcriptional regulator
MLAMATGIMQWQKLSEERCSLARSLAVVGDRWTLMILREAFLRVRRFEDFQSRLGIARRVLAERLTKLVDEGVLVRQPYQSGPVRHEYRLTDKGLAL